MAMVNPMINLQNMANVKDSRWLTLEVCREFQRNKCNRTDVECKFAHPPPHVEVQNGRVTCCFDSIKGKCQRKEPPCKYLHPPQHLREQLLQNGRNNLILKNLQMQALAAGVQPVVPGMIQTVPEDSQAPGQSMQPIPLQMPPSFTNWGYSSSHLGALYAAHPYLAMQGAAAFNPYISPGIPQMSSVMPTIDTQQVPVSNNSSQVAAAVMPTPLATTPKLQRADRLESSSTPTAAPNGTDVPNWTLSYPESSVAHTNSSQYSNVYFQPQVVEVLTAAGKKRPRDPADDLILGVVPGMVPYVKRQAVADTKSGIPMYQPSTGTAAYQQAALAMQLQHHQPFVPVTIAGHPSTVQRF